MLAHHHDPKGIHITRVVGFSIWVQELRGHVCGGPADASRVSHIILALRNGRCRALGLHSKLGQAKVSKEGRI